MRSTTRETVEKNIASYVAEAARLQKRCHREEDRFKREAIATIARGWLQLAMEMQRHLNKHETGA